MFFLRWAVGATVVDVSFKFSQLLDDGQALGTDTLYPPVRLLTRGQFVLTDAANTKARKSWAAARWLAARLAETETRASTCHRIRKTQKVWRRLFAVQMINELGGVCWPRESEGWAPAVHLSCWLQSHPDRSWLTLTDWATPPPARPPSSFTTPPHPQPGAHHVHPSC